MISAPFPPVPFAVCFVLIVASDLPAEVRTFTNTAGKQIRAEAVELEGERAVLRMEGRNYNVSLASLSPPDRDYLREWDRQKTVGRKRFANALGNFEHLRLGVWPETVSVGDGQDHYHQVRNPDGTHTYRGARFEFHVPVLLSAHEVRDFARIFEATYLFLEQAPLGLAPAPPANRRFRTRFFRTSAAYHATGAPRNSTGVFSYQYHHVPGTNPAETEFTRGEIRLPLPGIGARKTTTRFFLQDIDDRTLIHEIVHQVLMAWLPVMPTWMVEGFAEFVESQEYRDGTFHTTRMIPSVRDSVFGSGNHFTMTSLGELMSMKNDEWKRGLANGQAGRNYASANLLLTYFLLMDGTGNGEALVNYLRAVSLGTSPREATRTNLLRGRSHAILERDVAAAWKRQGGNIIFRKTPGLR